MWLILKLGCAGVATVLLGAMAFSEWTGGFLLTSIGFGGVLALLALFILLDAKEQKPKRRIAGENRP